MRKIDPDQNGGSSMSDTRSRRRREAKLVVRHGLAPLDYTDQEVADVIGISRGMYRRALDTGHDEQLAIGALWHAKSALSEARSALRDVECKWGRCSPDGIYTFRSDCAH